VSTLPIRSWISQLPRERRGILSSTRRRRFASLLLGALGAVLLLGGPAQAQATGTTPPAEPAAPADAGYVSVVTLTGLIDPILADLMGHALADARAGGARALVFQVDLDGSVIPPAQLRDLVDAMATDPVPVHVWVGPTGSQLSGDAAYLILGAKQVAMAPGTTVGGAHPVDGLFAGPRADVLRNGVYDTGAAQRAGLTTVDAPTLGAFYVGLPGVEYRTVTDGDQTHREPVTQAVFSQLSLLSGFLHTASSPAVAYLLLTIGLSLLVFELFTAGVGVAGALGAGSFVLACFGLAVLPTHWWAIAVLVASMVAFAIDVQTGVPRFWTGAGLALYTLGSLTLYDGVSMSWLTLLLGIGGVALAFLAGMPSMVRARFSTPTIGREWMVSEMGRAVTDIDPDGVVQLRGAQWRAYTNRATPIEALDKVRVVGIEGLVLEVEPEEGAARDYRERRPGGEREGHDGASSAAPGTA
jgi:membrane-bound serine protease (ClpP class)